MQFHRFFIILIAGVLFGIPAMASLPVTYVEDFKDYDFKSPTAATCSYVNTWVSWRAVCGSTYYNASITDIMGSQPLVLQPRDEDKG